MNTDKFYQKAKVVARKYYKLYKRVYSYNLLSCKDLEQECALKVAEIIQKYLNQSEKNIMKIINRSLPNLLADLRYASARHKRIFVEDYLPYTNEEEGFDNGNFDIEDLRDYLTHREYLVLFRRFSEDKTFKEIARELRLSEEGIRKIYIKSIQKLKKVMK